MLFCILISFLGFPRDRICERNQVSHMGEKAGLEGAGREEIIGKVTQCKFHRQTIPFLGSGVFKICLQDWVQLSGRRW
jgi:hypothetical protein